MIVAEQKPLNESKSMLKGCKKVLAVGCGTCVTVCFAGGKQEVLSSIDATRTNGSIVVAGKLTAYGIWIP